jgi:hypothetical protein
MVGGEIEAQMYHERRLAERMEDPEFRVAYVNALRELTQIEPFDPEVGVTTSHGAW